MGPWRLAWRAFRKRRPAVIGLWALAILYLLVLLADVIAPYHFDDQVRDLQWAPPTSLRFSDPRGFSWRPFVHPTRGYIDDNFQLRQTEDTSRRAYLRFLVPAEPHSILGILPVRFRLFGLDDVKDPAGASAYHARFYLLGADNAGRDIFSRICYGSRISMTIGLCGTGIVMLIGLAVGGISGYFGGWIDNLLQRLCEMIMLLPGFYLLLMLRFMFPANMSSVTVYFAVVLILALVGWAGFARVIRGMVLSIRGTDYVLAARALGLGHSRIIARHVLPNTAGYVIVSATLSIPGYILGESALSLLGLGIMEPTPSWGNMLQKAMDIVQLQQHPWVLWPGLFIFLAVMAFNMVGDGLRDALDPQRLRT
jgi:peptide/nickel transport system permease protein